MRIGHKEAPFLPAIVASFTAVVLMTAPVIAAEQLSLAEPKGEIVLTVKSSAAGDRSARVHHFDRASLESLGSTFLQTSTPWTDGTPLFRGVLVRDLLRSLGTHGEVARAIALNDYRRDIPLGDFFDYPVLLAYEMNGQALSVRGKGPIWIIYPLDQFDELRNRITERKMVWQLVELQIK